MIIGIIGIGLIGSSLARAFHAHGAGEVFIADKSEHHLDQAKKLKLGSRYFDTSQELAKHCDIIFMCVPVENIVHVAQEISPHLKKGAIITDVGSVKSFIKNQINSFLPEGVAFVPGHPIAGTEYSGPEAGKVDLFTNKTYVLVDDEKDRAATKKVADVLEKIGANISYLDADKHDLMLAFTSHLPHVCAFSAMVCSGKITAKAEENAMDFAGGSFRDLTRVAASNPDMWKGIFLTNRDHILEACRLFRQEMDILVSLVESADADGIKDYVDQARALRLRHYGDKGNA